MLTTFPLLYYSFQHCYCTFSQLLALISECLELTITPRLSIEFGVCRALVRMQFLFSYDTLHLQGASLIGIFLSGEEENLTYCLQRLIIFPICILCSYLIILSYHGLIAEGTALQKMSADCMLVYVGFMKGVMVSKLLTAYG